MPLHHTGVGLVLLAHADEDERAEVLATLGPPSGTAPLQRRLAEVRRAGVVVFDRRDPAPVASVAAPVRDGSGATVAAVSVVVPAGTSSPRAYEHVVSATARAISRGLV
jgi:DNA-binding IclR family transcriptional regulator